MPILKLPVAITVVLAAHLILAPGGERAVLAQSAETAPPVQSSATTKSRLVSSNWRLGCKPTNNETELACQATQTIIVEKSRKTLLALYVTPWKNKSVADYVLRVRLPHGVNIPAGVFIQIDGRPARSLVIQTSNKNGLFARIGLSKVLLANMHDGTSLSVSFQTLGGRKLKIPMTLKGFSSVFAKLQ